MKRLAIGIIAAGTLAGTMMVAAPAMAQVHVEGPGVGVRVGPEPRHDRWGHRDSYRSYAWRERGCRTVTVRERLPGGRVVVRTRERC